VALWDLKFTPSLGALRAYAQRHGLGSLGATKQDSPRARMQALLQAREETVARARGRVLKAVSMRDVDRVIRLFRGDPTTGSKSAEFAEEILARAAKSAEQKGYASIPEFLDAMEAAKPGESGKVKPEQIARREKTISNTKVRAYATIQKAEKPLTDLVDETYQDFRDFQQRLFQTGFQSAKLREFARFVDSGNNAVGTIEASVAAADMLQFIVGGFEALNTLWAEYAEGKFSTSAEVRARFLELALCDFYQLLATLRGKFGERDTDTLFIRAYRQAKVGDRNRLFYLLGVCHIPRRDAYSARVFYVDRCNLHNRHPRAIALYLYAIQNSRRRAPGAYPRKLLARPLLNLLNPLLKRFKIVCHGNSIANLKCGSVLPPMGRFLLGGLWMCRTCGRGPSSGRSG